MPAPQVQHGSELFPGMNKKDRASRFNLDPRTQAADGTQQAQGLLPQHKEASDYVKADKAGQRFTAMMNALRMLETTLRQTIPAAENGQHVTMLSLSVRHDTLVREILRYLNAHTFALGKNARRKKRLARRLLRAVKAQQSIVNSSVAGMDMTAYAGKMTYGDAILEAKNGFSLKGRASVPQADKADTLDMPRVKLGQVDDRVMQQVALGRKELRSTGDRGYSGVGGGMSKMLRMPNLKGQQGVQDEAGLLDEGKTYYFKRNLGDISGKVGAQREHLTVIEELAHDQAAALLRGKEPNLAIPQNPTARQREGIRLRAALYDPAWEQVKQDRRSQLVDSLRARSDALLDPNNSTDSIYADGSIEQVNRQIVEKLSKDFPKIADRAADINARYERETARLRQAKMGMVPVEYPKVENLSDREAASKGYVGQAVFHARGIHRRSANTAKKDVAYYKIDQLLGLNIVPQTLLAEDAHGRVGRLMEQFKGKEAVMKIEEMFTQDHKAARKKFRESRHFYKRLAEMHLLDLICGQGDRHGNNLTIYENDKGQLDVQAFDNDLAFGTKAQGFDGMVKSGGFSRFVPKETAEKILALKLDDIRAAVGPLLSAEEYEAMGGRLTAVQDAIREVKDNEGLLSAKDWDNLTDEQIEEFLWENRASSSISVELMQAGAQADIAAHKGKEYAEISRETTAELEKDEEFDKLANSIYYGMEKTKQAWYNKSELATSRVDSADDRFMNRFYAPGELDQKVDEELNKLETVFGELDKLLPTGELPDVDWSGIELPEKL